MKNRSSVQLRDIRGGGGPTVGKLRVLLGELGVELLEHLQHLLQQVRLREDSGSEVPGARLLSET